MKKIEILEGETDLVKLLQFQNRVLVDLYNSKVEEENKEKLYWWLKMGLKALPWIVVLVVIWWVFDYVNGVLISVNEKMEYLKNGYDGLVELVKAQRVLLEGVGDRVKGFLGGLI